MKSNGINYNAVGAGTFPGSEPGNAAKIRMHACSRMEPSESPEVGGVGGVERGERECLK